MKISKIFSIIVLGVMLTACAGPAGELVGARKSHDFTEAKPLGMLLIPRGNFLMGSNTQSAMFDQPDNNLKVTVESFWMDETEITNNEYRQFVEWVRDSIALTLLADGDSDGNWRVSPRGRNAEDDPDKVLPLNWRAKIPWGKFSDVQQEALSSMYYSDGETMNNMRLYYRYEWMNYSEAALPANKFDVAMGGYPEGAKVRIDTFWVNEDGKIDYKTITRVLREPSDLITHKIIGVYPDTLVWVRDFQYSFNDPLLSMYFSHEGYDDYPVVGVTWWQAHAFCNWRTAFFNNNSDVKAQAYRLPTEAEWEYAARGGRQQAMYPWGNNYARDQKGCYFANFKPYRGSYNEDTGTATVKVGQYDPNDFGLYDMAGNVSEWTNSAYRPDANTSVDDLNPDYSYLSRKDDPDVLKRKVVKGGSWKDISYYLQCGVRTFEYEYESRPYVGFRCVRSVVGSDFKAKKNTAAKKSKK